MLATIQTVVTSFHSTPYTTTREREREREKERERERERGERGGIMTARVSMNSLLVSTGSVVMLHICGIYIIVYVHNSFGMSCINLFSFVCLKHLTGAYQLNGPFISGHSMFRR